MRALDEAVPGAEFVLWGASDDERSFIHGTNESVDTGELERFIVAQALLLQGMGRKG
jgi:hypothetical protein